MKRNFIEAKITCEINFALSKYVQICKHDKCDCDNKKIQDIYCKINLQGDTIR